MSAAILDPTPVATLERVALAIMDGTAGQREAVDLLVVRYDLLSDGQKAAAEADFRKYYRL